MVIYSLEKAAIRVVDFAADNDWRTELWLESMESREEIDSM